MPGSPRSWASFGFVLYSSKTWKHSAIPFIPGRSPNGNSGRSSISRRKSKSSGSGKCFDPGHEIIAKSEYFGLDIQAEVLTQEAITTAAIEGEILARDSVRSSVSHCLGLPPAGLPVAERHIDGLVEVLIDATRNPWRTSLRIAA